MKLRSILLLISCILISASAISQSVTFSGKNIRLSDLLGVIKNQTGYLVFANKKQVDRARPITIEANQMPVKEFLTRILENSELEFSIQGNTISIKQKVVRKKEDPQQPSPVVETPPVTGIILGPDGKPLAFVNVQVKGGNRGAVADERGQFSITAEKGNILVISSVGYGERQVKVNGSSPVVITLEINSNPLDEVRVIAYGQDTRRFSVGSVSTVSAKEIQTQPVTNLFQALEGRVPGMIVTMTNGAPGALTLAQVRGQNTLSNKADPYAILQNYNQPLYIIDGVPLAIQNTPLAGGTLASPQGVGLWQNLNGLSPINGINPADIESISVLKDADATSIYGSQGSNGVVLITTKKGRPGKDKVDISVNSGPTTASRTTPMMNTQQYLEMRKEALANSGVTPTEATDPDLLIFDQNKYTNWMKTFYGGTARHTDSYVRLSGGSEQTSYLVGGGYTRDTYNYPGDFTEQRFSLHSSVYHTSADKRFTVDFGTDYAYDHNNSSGSGPNVFYGFTMAPNFPDLLDAGGNLVWSYKGFQFTSFNNNVGNPLAYIKQPGNVRVYSLNTHLSLKYQLFPFLSLGVNAGYGRISEDFYTAVPIASQNPVNGPTGSATFVKQNNDVINIEPQMNFTRRISKGVLTVLLGGTYKKTTMDGENIQAGNYSSDALLTSVAAAGSPPMVTNQASYYKYVAGFGRINYIWDSKYIISLTGNRNGSSNFGPEKRFGNFGSAGLGWILTGENSIQRALPFLSFAKLSVNYGTSGSDGVAPYQYQPNWVASIGVNYQGVQGLNPGNPLNPVYAWSLNKKFNEQLDLSFLKDRLYINITTYQNRAINQLVQYTEPIQTGFHFITTNAPYVVRNNGIEITMSSRNIIQKDFQWTTSFNIAHNSNKLTSFPDISSSPYAGVYVVGQPVTAKIVLPYLGVDPKTGNFTFRGTNANSAFNHVGGDATEIIDINPKFSGGLNNTFTYKGFNLSIFLQFVKQRGPNYLYSIYSGYFTGLAGQPLVNQPQAMLDRWKKPGDQAPIQRFVAGLYSNDDITTYTASRFFTSSTGAYSDASYVRVKNVSLSYRLPSSLLKKWFMQGCTLYINAQNLFLITGYKIGDPETMSIFSIPPQRTIAAGLNINF